jgi:integrase
MTATKLTKRELETVQRASKAQNRVFFLWDSELKGFGARVSPSRTSWLVQKWIGGRGGKAKRIVIGHAPPVALDDARKKAAAIISEVHQGADIISERRARRQKAREAAQAAKFEETVALYLRRKSQPGRFWSELEGRFEREIIPKIGKDTLVASITKADMRHLIETKEDTHPGAARTLFESLRPFFKWCVERDIIAVSPMQDLSPPPVPEARDRILTEDEIKSFWSATYQMGWPFCPLYRLLLLTAQRRDEVAGMRRSEIDLTKREWLIPSERTKNGKEHLVHLSAQAVSIIQELVENRSNSSSHNKDYGISDLIFTTTGTTPLSGFSRAKLALDGIMQPVKPWRIHDLRRTAASGMASLGFQPHIVERVLNHVSGAQGGLVGVYQRYEFVHERKRALEAWSAHIAMLVSGARTVGNVVPMREELALKSGLSS